MNYKKILQNIAKDPNRTDLEKQVADIITNELDFLLYSTEDNNELDSPLYSTKTLEDNNEDIKLWFNDLMQHGCQCGMVGELVYYTDTHKFYDKNYDDIEELRQDLEENIGETLKPKGDLKNWYAWMAFEETARNIALNDLKLDI